MDRQNGDSSETVMPHDLLSILYSVKGTIELHLHEMGDCTFPVANSRLRHAEDVLKKSHAKIQDALKMIKRFEQLKKPSPAKFSSSGSISILHVWQTVLSTLRQESLVKDIEVLEYIPKDFPQIACQPKELEEILYHLSKNACQAMSVSTYGNLSEISALKRLILRVQIGFSVREDPVVILTLADTGCGISKDKIQNLFQPFFTTKKWGEGNGLGLYISRRLIEKNHGRINVCSFKGFGTTFTLQFQIERQKLTNGNDCEASST